MTYRPFLFDFTRSLVLVAICYRGEKVIEVKWLPMSAVKICEVMR